MTPAEKKALVRSVYEGMREAVRVHVKGDSFYNKPDEWQSLDGERTWEGPEVVEVCEEVYREFLHWWSIFSAAAEEHA